MIALAASGCSWVVQVDAGPSGPANDASDTPVLSGDGRVVAFTSAATNLSAGDSNGVTDVFTRDLQSGVVARVSVSTAGVQGDAASGAPAVSATGRYVAFVSESSNLVASDTNDTADVFLRDRQLNVTERVSVGAAGAQTNDESFSPSISSDGRYVAFASAATNLVAGDSNLASDVFVRDRQTGTTTRASVNSTAGQGDDESSWPSVSSDGRYVAFASWASNLVAGDTNNLADIFVRDRQTNTTERVSVATGGAQGDGFCEHPALSGDGRFVGITCWSSNLVPGDTNGVADVFVRDRQTATTTRVSVTSAGAQGSGESDFASLSTDGRFVAFQSVAVLGAGGLVGSGNVYVRDRTRSTTALVSTDTLRARKPGDHFVGTVSGDGQYASFSAVDPTGAHVFARSTGVPVVTGIAPPTVARGTTVTLTLTGSGFEPSPVPTLYVSGTGVTMQVLTVTWISPTQLQAQVSVPAGSGTGPVNVLAVTPGTGPGPLTGSGGFCGACLAVT